MGIEGKGAGTYASLQRQNLNLAGNDGDVARLADGCTSSVVALLCGAQGIVVVGGDDDDTVARTQRTDARDLLPTLFSETVVRQKQE